MADPADAGQDPTSRRRLLSCGCLAAGMTAAATVIDAAAVTPGRLVTSEHDFGIAAPALERAAGRPLVIAQVSDLHLHAIGRLERQLIEQLHASPPDLVVLTGDAIDRSSRLPRLDELLAAFPRASRKLAILGNWEHRCGVKLLALQSTYERRGCELLVNQSIDITHGASVLRVTGLDDLMLGKPDPTAALAGKAPCRHHLVLTHCPAARDRLGLPAGHPATLVLSGHTHGGQIAPGGLALWRPPGSGRYVSGWYRDAGPPLYVSRGIGTSLAPVRLGATPELVRIRWWL